MSIGSCTCPLGTEIVDITDEACKFNFDLVIRIAFQRKQATAPFTVVAPIETEASWDVFLAASDATKIQFTPIFAATEVPSSAPLTFGGDDNTTPFGEQQLIGETSPQFTSLFQGLDPVIKKQIVEYSCESDLSIYLIDASGNVGALSTTVDEHFGIPIKSFFVGSRSLGGRTDPDQSQMTFSFIPAWDDDLTKEKPTFDILSKTNA